ncbi:UPF0692 protein CG33108 [Harmonia axyridis]|uniref:UPF0692 protein CG33108 n=1 Tax=Harmonia axyridis TaxID=115357 RepID=UPI001E275D13|nr:UPF0692 protein CG33108 [Harmonia axyridis]
MFDWASNHEELYKVCTLFNMTEIANPRRFSYKSLKGYIQEGPQCGLVALAIACENPNKEFVESIYEYAKEQKYTYNGEIFSSSYMEKLTIFFLKNKYDTHVYYGELNSIKTKEHLLTGGLILVPYDTDKNNSPGLYNGHKAHWAVICGAIETNNDFYVIARHGKAKNIAIWALEDLSISNMQLNEFAPDRKNSNLEYRIPEGGLNGSCGLRNTSVFLNKI